MTVQEGIGRVRKAQRIARNLGVTIRRSVPDEIQPTVDRHEVVMSVGFDAKRPKLAPTGDSYRMTPAPVAAIGSSVALLAGGAATGYIALNNMVGKDRDLITATVAGLASLGMFAAIAPFNIDY